MLKNYVETLKALSKNEDGVVSFEYVIVAACVVAVVVAAFGTGASWCHRGSADYRVRRDHRPLSLRLYCCLDSRAGHWDVPMPRFL